MWKSCHSHKEGGKKKKGRGHWQLTHYNSQKSVTCLIFWAVQCCHFSPRIFVFFWGSASQFRTHCVWAERSVGAWKWSAWHACVLLTFWTVWNAGFQSPLHLSSLLSSLYFSLSLFHCYFKSNNLTLCTQNKCYKLACSQMKSMRVSPNVSTWQWFCICKSCCSR